MSSNCNAELEEGMTADRLRDILSKRPFRRFSMKLADGSRIPVHHPEVVALSPSGRTAVVVKPDESIEIVDLLLVTSLELPSTRNRTPRSRLN